MLSLNTDRGLIVQMSFLEEEWGRVALIPSRLGLKEACGRILHLSWSVILTCSPSVQVLRLLHNVPN